MEVWCRAKDFGVQNLRNVMYHGQVKFFEILQYISSQAASSQASQAASAEKEKAK